MKNLFFTLLLILPMALFAQTFEAEINQEGVTFPKVNTSQRNALTAVEGQCIYNTDNKRVECFDGSSWPLDTDVKFSARMGQDYAIPNFTETALTVFVEDFDSGNYFNPTTGIFTAPVDGLYHFDLKLDFAKDTEDFDNIPVLFRFKVNGSTVKGHGQFVDRITLRSNYGQDLNYGTNIELNAGDQVGMTVRVISGSATSDVIIGYSNSSADSTFSGFLIN